MGLKNFLSAMIAITATVSPAISSPIDPRQIYGCAVVTNLCNFDVYYVNVPQQGYGRDEAGTIPPGKSYRAYYDGPQIGHSIKLSLTHGVLSDILQFEYSQTLDGHIDYDVSKIDGNPFATYGFSLDAEPGCPIVRCESPVDGCAGTYEEPIYNVNPNYYCPLSADTGVTLCSG